MLRAALLRTRNPGMKPLPDVGSQFWSLPFCSTQGTIGSSPLNSQAAFPWLLIELALSCFLASERPGEWLKDGRIQGVLSFDSVSGSSCDSGRPALFLPLQGPHPGLPKTLFPSLSLPSLVAVIYP